MKTTQGRLGISRTVDQHGNPTFKVSLYDKNQLAAAMEITPSALGMLFAGREMVEGVLEFNDSGTIGKQLVEKVEFIPVPQMSEGLLEEEERDIALLKFETDGWVARKQDYGDYTRRSTTYSFPQSDGTPGAKVRGYMVRFSRYADSGEDMKNGTGA